MMPVRVTIEGEEIDPHRIWYSEMSLSSARPRVPPSAFRLEAPAEAVVQSLAEPYARVVRELREDEELTGESNSLSEAGYPPLDRLLDDPPLAADVLRTFLHIELLDPILPWGNSGSGSYVIDTFTSVGLEGDRIVITGECLRI